MSTSVRRLFETFQPEHYDLSITLDRTARTFSGRVRVTGKKTGRPSQRLTFHQNGLKITKATAVKHDKTGTTEVAISRINQQDSLHEVRLHSEAMLYPGQYEVTMEFESAITDGMTGLYPCYFKKDGVEDFLLATQLESHHAREVFPCIDEPEAKATFDVSLVHETGLTALGNMPVAETEDADGRTTTRFETSPRMSCYLLAFVVGKIHAIHGKTKRGTEVNIWGTVAQPADSFEYALSVATGSIEFFEDFFGVDYPLPKADHIALPDFSSGAMENWGLVTYREAVLLLYPAEASQSTRELIALVVAHETSHQWFGNLVTMKWWDDLWLNESFANMMEYQAVDALHPDWNIWNTFVAAEGLSALRRDSTYGVQAVRTEVHHPDEISTLFDPSIVYAKGGRLLYMLKNHIGDEAFRQGLQAYFTKHAYGNTTGDDLWAALSDASGVDVAAFMTPWLRQSGFPVITVDQAGTKLTLSQQHFLDNPAKADAKRRWPVPLFAGRSDVPDRLDKATVKAQLETDEYVRPNQDARGHYLVRYVQPEHRQHLVDLAAKKQLSEADRLMLLNNSVMLSKTGLEPFADTLRLLSAYEQEDSETVWDMIALALGDAKRFVDLDENLEPMLKTLIKKLVSPQYDQLGWEEKADESAEDRKLRATIIALGSYAEHDAITTRGLELFEIYKRTPTAVSAELRGIVFGIAVKHRVAGVLDYLLELHKTTNNSDLQRDIAGALTTTHETSDADILLGHITDPKTVKPQDADRWLFFMLRNRHLREHAWDWMEKNWNWIEETYRNDKSYDYFPRFCAGITNTRHLQKRFEAFFGPKKDNVTLKRNIMIGLEEIDSRLPWLERDLPAVRDYFKVS